MPPATANDRQVEYRTCPHCNQEFNVRGFTPHQRACIKKKTASRQERALAARMNSIERQEPRPSGSGIPIDDPINPPLDDVPDPWDAADPNIASSDQAAPMLDDIRVEYHPKAKVPPKVFSFEDYGREQDKPPARAFVKDPWLPAFETRLNFEFAELTLECGMNKHQIESLLRIVHHISDDPSQFTYKTYEDLKGSWDVVGEMHPPFEKHSINVPYKNKDSIVDVHIRDVWKLVLQQVRDPLLAPHFNWDATRVSKWNGQQWVRWYEEPWTGNTLWEAYVGT
ncbi:hypothetical protein PHLCEN_2v7846 [Hermanssonia centrifuga]|uniref:Uncharacterized protein n=1 Tax=Hermanssonia centrifuga TaxID=98765 RepID=A0A2R6NVD7_9APHY|nr:hypothetical protein PHLCEN_2v7846 [Hermanssonia centrifuga]